MKIINLSGMSRKKTAAIVISIALLQLVFLIWEFCLLKSSYSGDEIYSYATANSGQSMNPIIDMDGTFHINEWLTSDRLFQAVTVSRDEVFDYDQIVKILRDDAHPPLYFFLLHFFCTFFIGRFSWIPSIIINSVAIFTGQIFFYRLFLLLSKNRFRSVIAMLFFGFTTAVINMMTFARNYTLLTALTLIFTFYIFRSMQQYSSRKNNTKSILLAALFLYLAAMTQYLSVLFGFFITLSVCIYYFVRKDLKSMFKTGLSMTGSIVLMMVTFHDVFHQLAIDQTSMESATDYPFRLELRVAVHILFNEIFGINTPVYPTMLLFWLFWGLVGVMLICLIMGFLFRSDIWFIRIRDKIRDMMKSVLHRLNDQLAFQYFSLLFTVIVLVAVISYNFKMYFFYPNSNRYLFMLYPYVVIIFLLPVLYIVKNDIVRMLLIIALSCMSLLYGRKTNIYSFQMTMKEAADTIEGSDVMVFIPGYYVVNNSLLYMEKCDRVFYTTKDTFRDDSDIFVSGLSDDKPLYMMYYWPAYNNETTDSDLQDMLKFLKESGITTVSDNPQNHGAELIAGVGGHLLIKLR